MKVKIQTRYVVSRVYIYNFLLVDTRQVPIYLPTYYFIKIVSNLLIIIIVIKTHGLACVGRHRRRRRRRFNYYYLYNIICMPSSLLLRTLHQFRFVVIIRRHRRRCVQIIVSVSQIYLLRSPRILYSNSLPFVYIIS